MHLLSAASLKVKTEETDLLLRCSSATLAQAATAEVAATAAAAKAPAAKAAAAEASAARAAASCCLSTLPVAGPPLHPKP